MMKPKEQGTRNQSLASLMIIKEKDKATQITLKSSFHLWAWSLSFEFMKDLTSI